MASSPSILHVAGFTSCGFYRRCHGILSSLATLFPSRIQVVEHAFEDRTSYRSWLIGDETNGFRNQFNDTRATSHSSSPFVWFSKTSDENDIDSFLGGHDDTLDWCRANFNPEAKTNGAKDEDADVTSIMVNDGYTADHGYDYDLVVIGGGSGGMAAAKQAATLGARVACLDFVKPSPHGTTWGLGGTCVNVGCIPKKLFHFASSMRESVHKDAAAYGIDILATQTNGDSGKEPPEMLADIENIQHRWNVLRENIQNYIKSLNFKYRVALREKSVTYLNKLGEFVDKNTLQVTDKKGRKDTITAARFLVAVGGRPAPLECEGGDLAISSDDIFSMQKSPGKTLCVGASYISLECAGFLRGLGLDVTVAVRSILLRGFDRECSDRIQSFMEHDSHVKFKLQVTPTKLEKVADDKIKVTFSDGSQDTFDTVLVAIGRIADTAKLGIDKVGVKLNPKNQKILGKYEQSVSCPNIYAVGDVLEGSPELTPVAIQAGQLLAKRLFTNPKPCGATKSSYFNEKMDYVNVCTTVFTPIEYACVGLSEEDAIEQVGKDNIDVYHREFVPLEWSMSFGRTVNNAFTKVIVDKISIPNEEKVLGIHYVGPNAGEVMQGYGISMKQSLTFKQLTDTVGIHPTNSEEIVTLSVTKSSGEDAAAGGC